MLKSNKHLTGSRAAMVRESEQEHLFVDLTVVYNICSPVRPKRDRLRGAALNYAPSSLAEKSRPKFFHWLADLILYAL